MSRSKKKMAIIHDLQGRGDCIVTKADCDLIANALTYYGEQLRKFNQEKYNKVHARIFWDSMYFNNLTKISRSKKKPFNTIMSRNKLRARAKAYARREEKKNVETEYCTESGKICYGTRGEAERTARDIGRAHNGHNVSVYMCDACGCYHVTRAGYEKSKHIRQGKMANKGKLYE